MTNIFLRLLITTLCSGFAFVASADDAARYNESNLTGDWGGMRTTLFNSGIDIEVGYTFDVVGNVSGGIDEGMRGLDNLDVILSFDGEKMFGSKGTSALFHFANNNGGHPDVDLVGSAQGINNYEVPDASAKIYQAWVQQNFLDDKISVLGGLYDVNSEFYITDSSLLFIHSAYGIGTDIALSGVNGPSTFPFTGLSGRVKIQPDPHYYVMAAVLDGVPGKLSKPRGTHIGWHDDDGSLVIGEAAFIPGGENPTGKLAVGGWYYTEKFPHQVTAEMERSEGAYIIGEHKLNDNLTGFVRFGVADGDVNQFNYTWVTGLVYTGLIPGRDEGQLGFGINSAHNSSSFKQASLDASTPVDSAETTLELTYRDNLTPWLAIQPDIQYIINPGTDPALDNALVVGSRFTVTF